MSTSSVNGVSWGWVVLAACLAAVPARADRFSFGLGVGNGSGGFFTFGMSSGGGHGGHGHYRGRPVCAPRPPVCAPPPVFCAPRPVVCAPPPVVVCAPPVRTVVVGGGYWLERETRVWVEGFWVESFDAYGRRCKTWQPGRWEVRRTREWVQP